MNVFGQIPKPMGPDGATSQDPNADITQALTAMMEKQQEGEPQPRQPTPQEAQQLKQAGMQMLQAKGMAPGQGQPQGQGSATGAAFMGQGGMNPAYAQHQVPPSPSQA